MAAKTITIDLEAYKRLKNAKQKNESFSQTIKRVVPSPIDLQAWLKRLESDPASEEFVDAVERQIESRSSRSRRGR